MKYFIQNLSYMYQNAIFLSVIQSMPPKCEISKLLPRDIPVKMFSYIQHEHAVILTSINAVLKIV